MKRLLAGLALAILAVAPAFAALKPGAKAPDFTGPAYLAGKPFTFSLSRALAKGPVVIFFFPSAYSKGCNLETKAFSDAADAFKAEGASLVGVTAGNVEKLAAFSMETEHCGGKFPVVADTGVRIAKTYDVVLLGINLAGRGLSNRTSYVIAPNGTVIHTYTAMAPNDHVSESLNAVKTWRARPALRVRQAE